MKVIQGFVFLCLLVSVQANAAVSKDKYLHFGVSSAVSVMAYEYTGHGSGAFAACMLVGVSKEVYDHIDYGRFDVADVAADGFGCAAGIALSHYVSIPISMDYNSYRGLMLSLNFKF
ncbi:hypothetical protein [Vibrio owensii]|uniref:hypothetical protein n=1 Tax=Vibrio owensii TaxID=696485 RepID=UPI0018F1E0AA|nr:hypothetical protein [Vibrio owensii]